MVQAGPIFYTYDHADRLITRAENGKQEHFFYFDEHELGSTKALRILAKNISAIEIQGDLYPALCDHRGNPVLIQDSSGDILTRHDYSAFGESTCIGSFESPWQYSGMRIDPTTHLLHFPKRVYNPRTGTWMTPDPAGFNDGLNLLSLCPPQRVE